VAQVRQMQETNVAPRRHKRQSKVDYTLFPRKQFVVTGVRKVDFPRNHTGRRVGTALLLQEQYSENSARASKRLPKVKFAYFDKLFLL
jgi:hypothetical protein